MFENVYESFNLKDKIKIANVETKYKTKCKCGATLVFLNVDRRICHICGNYVYKNGKAKFKYEVLKKIKEREEV